MSTWLSLCVLERSTSQRHWICPSQPLETGRSMGTWWSDVMAQARDEMMTMMTVSLLMMITFSTQHFVEWWLWTCNLCFSCEALQRSITSQSLHVEIVWMRPWLCWNLLPSSVKIVFTFISLLTMNCGHSFNSRLESMLLLAYLSDFQVQQFLLWLFFCVFVICYSLLLFPFGAVTLLVGWQGGHVVHKNCFRTPGMAVNVSRRVQPRVPCRYKRVFACPVRTLSIRMAGNLNWRWQPGNQGLGLPYYGEYRFSSDRYSSVFLYCLLIVTLSAFSLQAHYDLSRLADREKRLRPS